MAVNPAPSRNPGSIMAGGRLRGQVEGLPLSKREIAMLRLYALTGDRRVAAHQLGVADRTGENYLAHVYAKLGVQGGIAAFRAMGWLQVPRRAA